MTLFRIFKEFPGNLSTGNKWRINGIVKKATNNMAERLPENATRCTRKNYIRKTAPSTPVIARAKIACC